MKSVTVLLLIAIAILAGCSVPEVVPPPEVTATKNPEVASTQENQPIETGQEVKIVFKKSGGIAGVDQGWRINSDGSITTSDGKTGQVSASQLSEVVVALDKLGFFEMQESYMPVNTCCDRFTYQLEVTVDGKSHSVTALEGAQETPNEFWQALDIVNGLLANVK